MGMCTKLYSITNAYWLLIICEEVLITPFGASFIKLHLFCTIHRKEWITIISNWKSRTDHPFIHSTWLCYVMNLHFLKLLNIVYASCVTFISSLSKSLATILSMFTLRLLYVNFSNFVWLHFNFFHKCNIFFFFFFRVRPIFSRFSWVFFTEHKIPNTGILTQSTQKCTKNSYTETDTPVLYSNWIQSNIF